MKDFPTWKVLDSTSTWVSDKNVMIFRKSIAFIYISYLDRIYNVEESGIENVL